MHGQTQRSEKSELYEKILSDRDTKLILESTYDVSKSANQIILESNLAQSTTYRKLKRLVETNLLQIEYVVGMSGRWEMRYKTNACLFHTRSQK
ncbi:MAG TPA: hypothetical protein VJR22_00650 [Candidatus Nitrosotalea sp.]|nr:hypothetical protein [Nitrososphaerota archaeon]HKU32339.1 hypothetical protein [Candidatus Nitrosotalea sp.]